jgi:bifunctional non-homologous end joining protein LigD
MLEDSRRFLRFVSSFSPMLISPGDLPSVRNGWIFEPKLDGMRGVAFVDGGECRIYSRHGKDHSHRFPMIRKALSKLQGSLVLDGEIACLDEAGRPCLEFIQERILMEREIDIKAAEQEHPACFFGFDAVYADEQLLDVPLLRRKELLFQRMPKSEVIIHVAHYDENPEMLFQACVAKGLEGIVAKLPDSKYLPGVRSSSWVKIKARQTDSFVVGGHTEDHGFLVGQYEEDGSLRYCGNVEAGFRNCDYDQLFERARTVEKSPFANLHRKKQTTWFAPDLVLEVRFLRWTSNSMIREGVFKGFRNDLPAAAVRFVYKEY